MTERLKGERLVAKVVELSASLNPIALGVLKERELSKVCIGCGYMNNNESPDFVRFFEALKEVVPGELIEQEGGICGEKVEELPDQPFYQAREYVTILINQEAERYVQTEASRLVAEACKEVSDLLSSRFGIRKRLVIATGFKFLLTAQERDRISNFYGQRSLEEEEAANHQGVMRSLTKAIAFKTSDELLYRRGMHWLDFYDNWQMAVADFTEALRINPNNEDALWKRAQTLHTWLERHRDALKDFTRLLRMTRNDFYRESIAECLLAMGDTEEVRQEALKVLRSNPINEVAIDSLEVLREVEKISGDISQSSKYGEIIDSIAGKPRGALYVSPHEEKKSF